MMVLVETAAGLGLFKIENSSLLSMSVGELVSHFETGSSEDFSLHSFRRFACTKKALPEVNALIEGNLGSELKKLIRRDFLRDESVCNNELLVSDKLLCSRFNEEFRIKAIYNPKTLEIVKAIKLQFSSLLKDLSKQELDAMSLSLAHSITRFKLRFSPEKVDTMIIQAISLLDDVDREVNNFAMRMREWYGWHFPELGNLVHDNLLYAKITHLIGDRSNLESLSLDDLVPYEIESEIKKASQTSMGTDITSGDVISIRALCQRVIELLDTRAELADYIKHRMEALAPNLTYMIGDVLAARLISHAGSLVALSKQPSSTVQLLGAEKALFRALKNKTPTPKYGLIYQASLVSQAVQKHKGRVSRSFAAKLSLCSRVDALRENEGPTIGIEAKKNLEKRLNLMKEELAKKESASHERPTTPKQELKRPRDIDTYDPNADVAVMKKAKQRQSVKDEA